MICTRTREGQPDTSYAMLEEDGYRIDREAARLEGDKANSER